MRWWYGGWHDIAQELLHGLRGVLHDDRQLGDDGLARRRSVERQHAIDLGLRARLGEQDSRHRRCIHFGCRGHPLVGLTGQLLNVHVRKDGRQRIGDVEISRALGADLEHHRDRKVTKALRLEVVPAQRPQVTE